MLTFGSKGEAAVFHLSIHAQEKGVFFHFEGLGLDKNLLIVSLDELRKGIQRWIDCFTDLISDLDTHWDFRSYSHLIVVPLPLRTLQLPEHPATGKKPRRLEPAKPTLVDFLRS